MYNATIVHLPSTYFVFIAIVILFPCFTIATITAAAAKRGTHFIPMVTMC